MNSVEPIRDFKKIIAIKHYLRSQPRNYLLFTLGINSALRIGDMLKLKVKDLLTEQGEIREILSGNAEKTGKEYKIKINESTKEAINYYLENIRPNNMNQYLFYRKEKTDKPISRIRVWQLIQFWTKKVGLNYRNYGAHTLRKTWGYQARKQGITIEQVSAKLGHRSVEVTRRYIGIDQDEINQIEDEVNL
jgi:integrase